MTSATKTDFESKTLAEISKQLLTVTSRHKRQVEEMSKEQLRWQQNMQAKLSKMASMCEELNKESELRKHEAAHLNREVINTRADRDALRTQVEDLQTEAILFQREKLEHRQLREILHQYETEGLARAPDAVEQRDQVINALSTRLERALDTLDVERQQQRQRRHIIFPSRSGLPGSLEHGSTSPSASPNEEVASLKEELRVAHDDTRQAKAALEATKAEAIKVDEEWLARYTKLEKECQLLKGGRLNKDD
jgi:chromosome segregation ATPase